MRKLRPLLFCLTFAFCALCLGGCTSDNNDGSSKPSTSAPSTTDRGTENNKETDNNRETDNTRETDNNSEGNNKNDNTGSTKGIMEDFGNDIETIIDDTATMFDPRR